MCASANLVLNYRPFGGVPKWTAIKKAAGFARPNKEREINRTSAKSREIVSKLSTI